ncbi:recombinase family protein [Kribbella endophytica]
MDGPYLPTTDDRYFLQSQSLDFEVQSFDVATGQPVEVDESLVGRRAVIYLRVSTKDQVDTDYDPEGISLPARRQAYYRRAEQQDLVFIDEYVEPGKSATEMSKRVVFQQMLSRVRERKDVDIIIFYKLNRMARSRYDDAIVMAGLRKRGVSVISATEAIDDTPVGQLMHGILATFNEYQSKESGADISYKMGQKAKNGGTIGLAPLGYLNVIDQFEFRQIRTVAFDPVRAALIKVAFELYATGDYTLADLSDELYDRGLRTRPTRKTPSQRVSINKLSKMLRDRYYLGFVTYKGEWIPGRHEALIDEELFEQVQAIAVSHSMAGERRRTHHHHLKGSLYCGRCHRRRVEQRLVIQHTTNSRGSKYEYFFCVNKRTSECTTPHVNTMQVEDAVERVYGAVRFSRQFIEQTRAHVAAALSNHQRSARLLKQQLQAELKALDAKETTCWI